MNKTLIQAAVKDDKAKADLKTCSRNIANMKLDNDAHYSLAISITTVATEDTDSKFPFLISYYY